MGNVLPTFILGIQAILGWSTVTGPSIGPVAPNLFTFQQGTTQWLPQAGLISVTGVPGKYADGMLKYSHVLPANTGHLIMTANFALDADSLINAQALELGTKITDENGITYNGQIQFDYSTSPTEMVLDVVNKDYTWTRTRLSLPKFVPNTEYEVNITYGFDTVSRTISVLSVSINGVVYVTPADLIDLPGQNLGWGKNQMVAGFQPDVNTKGGSFQWMLYEVNWAVS